MRVELLDEPDDPESLLRLYAFTPRQFEELCGWFLFLAESEVGASVRIAPQEDVEALGCSGLEAVVSERDEGVLRGEPLQLRLEADTWRVVLDRARALNPHDPNTYQWLVEEGAFPVLLSLSGQW